VVTCSAHTGLGKSLLGGVFLGLGSPEENQPPHPRPLLLRRRGNIFYLDVNRDVSAVANPWRDKSAGQAGALPGVRPSRALQRPNDQSAQKNTGHPSFQFRERLRNPGPLAISGLLRPRRARAAAGYDFAYFSIRSFAAAA
jgi:hypothetical protein